MSESLYRDKAPTPYEALEGDDEIWRELPEDFVFDFDCEDRCGRKAIKSATWYINDTPMRFYCSHECAVSHLSRIGIAVK